jgi:hypothetical protein
VNKAHTRRSAGPTVLSYRKSLRSNSLLGLRSVKPQRTSCTLRASGSEPNSMRFAKKTSTRRVVAAAVAAADKAAEEASEGVEEFKRAARAEIGIE